MHKQPADRAGRSLRAGQIWNARAPSLSRRYFFEVAQIAFLRLLKNRQWLLIPCKFMRWRKMDYGWMRCKRYFSITLQGCMITRWVGFSDTWFWFSLGLLGRTTAPMQPGQVVYSSSNFLWKQSPNWHDRVIIKLCTETEFQRRTTLSVPKVVWTRGMKECRALCRYSESHI